MGPGHDHVRVSSWWRSLLACDVRARVWKAQSHPPFIVAGFGEVCGGEEEERCGEGDAGDAGVGVEGIGGGVGGDGDWYVFNSNCKRV